MKSAQQIIQELNSLDPQEPGNWPTYVHIGITVLLFLGILVGGYFYIVTDMQDELAAEKAKEPPLKTEFENKQRKVAALDALKEQLEEMEKSFGAMLRQLPSKAEIANLLIDISQTRLANSLEEELFQPQSESPREFYAEVPNAIVVVGGYHEMARFVSDVAALPRIVTIDSVEIQPVDKSRDDVRMRAIAKTYRYLDEDEVAASTAQQKGRRR